MYHLFSFDDGSFSTVTFHCFLFSFFRRKSLSIKQEKRKHRQSLSVCHYFVPNTSSTTTIHDTCFLLHRSSYLTISTPLPVKSLRPQPERLFFCKRVSRTRYVHRTPYRSFPSIVHVSGPYPCSKRTPSQSFSILLSLSQLYFILPLVR